MQRRISSLICVLSLFQGSAHAEGPLRRGLFYAPAINKTHLVFVRAGALWRASREGGPAKDLGVPANSNSHPLFSPDGKSIALMTMFNGAYELGITSIDGGPLRRVTHYPRNGKGLMQWLPSDRLLYFTEGDFRFVASQIFTIPTKGGMPTRVDVPYGADCSLSADGSRLAYILHMRRDFYWKQYQGGMAPDIWLYNLKTGKSKQVTRWKGYDCRPMWRGDDIYYISDEGPERTMNVWRYDTRTDRRRQVTHTRGVDIQNPYMSLETNEIAYQKGGDIWVLDLKSERQRRVPIEIPEAEMQVSTRNIEASRSIVSRTVSPSADWVVTEARGDLWLTPPSGGTPTNLTATDSVFERDPAWSPDGKHIAFFSDETGEYQLTLLDVATRQRRALTSFRSEFRQAPRWSPDSRTIAFTDNAGRFYSCDVGTGAVTRFDADTFGQIQPLTWSPDSRWIAYTKIGKNQQSAIWVHDMRDGRNYRLTSGFTSDALPCFDPSGNTLVYASIRDFSRRINQMFDRLTVYPTPMVLIAVPLRKGASVRETKVQERVEIDFDGFEARGVQLAAPSGRFTTLTAGKGGTVFYHRTNPMQNAALQMLDAAGRQQTVLDGADTFEMSADGSKLLAFKGGDAFVIDAAPDPKPSAAIVSTGYSMTVSPIHEWSQISRDVWRLFRDYFYDPNMHGLDWQAQWRRFQPLLGLVADREDLNYVLGEMISDLSVGHAMMTGPGDVPNQPWVAAGQLGADYELVNGAFRIKRIIRGAPWDPAGRGPLSVPGSEVHEGEYLLALNGTPLDAKSDPWAPFIGLAGKAVTITVGPNPKIDSQARQVTVTPLERESDLRMRDWVERNRRSVDRASKGQLGYIYLPDEGPAGNAEFARQFYGQLDKKGVIVDVRWNTGGTSSDRMIEMLNRPLLNAITERYTMQSFTVPGSHIAGPKALLINRVTSSSGENFAYYFRKAGLGKLIGTRTWGGLIGVNGNQALIDGGFWWIPQAAFFIDQKTWMPEGEGIRPDIEVMDDPAAMRGGRDPQLEAAVRDLMNDLARVPPKDLTPPRPRRGPGGVG